VVNSSGALQGGLLATLIDSVGGMALMEADANRVAAVTSEMQISFLAGARVGPVRAAAHILRRGGRSAVVRVDVWDTGADGLHVATATLRFAFAGPGRGGGDGAASRGPAGTGEAGVGEKPPTGGRN